MPSSKTHTKKKTGQNKWKQPGNRILLEKYRRYKVLPYAFLLKTSSIFCKVKYFSKRTRTLFNSIIEYYLILQMVLDPFRESLGTENRFFLSRKSPSDIYYSEVH